MTAPSARLAATNRAGRRNEAWKDRARCAIEYGPGFDREPVASQIACCQECPVPDECLDYALRTESSWASKIAPCALPIYGGTTATERNKLRQAVAVDAC